MNQMIVNESNYTSLNNEAQFGYIYVVELGSPSEIGDGNILERTPIFITTLRRMKTGNWSAAILTQMKTNEFIIQI